MSTDAAPTITEFLLARISEDEVKADEMATTAWYDGGWAMEDAERLRKDCTAKRAIIEQWDDPAFSDQGAYDAGHARAMDDAVRALAAVYADHPDYRQEWAARG